MSADELRAQVNGIVTRISTAQYHYQKAKNDLDEVTQELLALDIGGSKSPHVATSNRLLPMVLSEHQQLVFDLSLIHSEMLQYRNVL